MKWIGYFKAEPTEFARMSVNGKTKKEGKGISGFYVPFRTSIELVSIAAQDQPFVFNEISCDNQEIALQGELVYAVTKPELVLCKYDMSIDPRTKAYITEDGCKIPEHVLLNVQQAARKIVQETKTDKLLFMGKDLSEIVLDIMRKSDRLTSMGVNLELVHFSSIKPSPEIAKALEAEYREGLLQKADEAIYSRRAIAVEKERTIQKNEMQTKIDVEEQRKQLVGLQAENIMEEAKAKADAARKELAAFDGIEPAKLTAQALYQIGKNAGKIGTLTITPDILASILHGAKKGE